jgi:hypothetical protein
MTLKLEIPPETEANLIARAQADGVPLEEFLMNLLVREAVQPVRDERPLTGRQKAVAFRAWANSFPLGLPVLSLEDIRGEKMYQRD